MTKRLQYVLKGSGCRWVFMHADSYIFQRIKNMAMHSNWNPWHGCIKCSEGCQNCYVYYLDRMRGRSGSDVYKTKTGFGYP